MEKRNFGYLPSPPDYRDFRYGNMVPLKTDNLPDKFLLEKTIVRDQGQWGSCVGHAAASLKISQEKLDNPQVNLDFSPLFIYSLCKQRDGIPEKGRNLHSDSYGCIDKRWVLLGERHAILY